MGSLSDNARIARRSTDGRGPFASRLAQCMNGLRCGVKDVYRGYYPLTDGEVDDLWQSGLVVVDTNVLLNMYRTTPASRRAVLDSLKALHERLWLPHHVGLEFHKMREEVRQGARRAHREKARRIETDAAKIRSLADEAAALNDEVDADSSLRAGLTEAAKLLANEVRAGQEPFDEEADGDDELLLEIERLYRPHQVGSRFSETELVGLRQQAEDRYSRSIPPGFEDKAKTGDRRFGDFFIWKQMMAAANEKKAGVIFVTNDEKADWKRDGKALPELLQEFHEETGQIVHIYSPKGFISEARRRSLWTPDSDSDADGVAAELETYVDNTKATRTPAIPSNVSPFNALGLNQAAFLDAVAASGSLASLQAGIRSWLPYIGIDSSYFGLSEALLDQVVSASDRAPGGRRGVGDDRDDERDEGLEPDADTLNV